MSISTVEIRAFSGPDLVELGSAGRPTIIRLNVGPKGDPGAAATIAVGTTTTLSPGASATVTNAGTSSAAVFNFGIPTGVTGATGATGATGTAATVTVGTTTTGSAGTNASVTNSGTTSAAVFNFTIPRGDTGETGATGAAGPNSVTSETTSDGTALLNISNLTLSQAITSGIQTKMTFTAQPTTVGDGQQIIWQWYNGGSPVTTAVIATEVTSSNSDKLIFKTSESGSLATSLDLNNSLATFSGVVSSLGSTYQTGSTFTYNGASAAAHRTALGVSASGDTVLKSAYTPAHSLLVQQSGTGSPSSLSVGNNTILGRASGGGSAIAALSGSDARTVLGLSTLATTTPAVNVATFLESPTSANLAAAVTDETGSGSLVFGTSPTIDTPTITTPSFTRATSGQVFSATGSLTEYVKFTTDSSGRAFFTVVGNPSASSVAGGSYVTAQGVQEGWMYVTATANTSGMRVMRFGNLSNRFSIQRLNDTNTAITATPFSIANNAPDNSFYMNASGGITLGATTDAGATNLLVAGTITANGKITAGAAVKLKGYTVATLPAGTVGDTAYVTDALAPTFLGVLVGGGTITTTCFYNGTNWVAQ